MIFFNRVISFFKLSTSSSLFFTTPLFSIPIGVISIKPLDSPEMMVELVPLAEKEKGRVRESERDKNSHEYLLNDYSTYFIIINDLFTSNLLFEIFKILSFIHPFDTS